MKFNTSLIHSGNARKEGQHATAVPIYQNNSFYQDSAEELEKAFRSQEYGYAYTRMGNPTITEFEERVAELEGGVGAAAFASGMAAITLALLNILEEGDELIASTSLFSGTLGLFKEITSFGITTKLVTDMTPEEVEKQITDKTKVVFAELIGNPRLDIVDIAAVKEVTAKYNIPFIIDSTTATPYLLRPLEYGADIVVHSSSKYMSGNGNALSGVVIDGGTFDWKSFSNKAMTPFKPFGKQAYIMKLKKGISQKFGPVMAPLNAYINIAGLEMLGIKMERLCENTYKVAAALEAAGIFDEVHYPGLESSPWHELALKQFGRKEVGSIFTFRAGSKERAYKVMNNLKYAYIATNIGDVRTLVIHPASTIYMASTADEKAKAGVYEDSIRVSIGLEDPDDLIEDFIQAAEKADKE